MRPPTQTGLVVSIANRNNINALAGMKTVVDIKVDDDVIARAAINRSVPGKLLMDAR